MNSFQRIAKRLIGIKAFKSTCTIIEYTQQKNDKGRVIYLQTNRFECNCLVGNRTDTLENNIHKINLYIIVSALDIQGLNIDNKLKVIVNGKQYNVEIVYDQGCIGNQILTYRFELTK